MRDCARVFSGDVQRWPVESRRERCAVDNQNVTYPQRDTPRLASTSVLPTRCAVIDSHGHTTRPAEESPHQSLTKAAAGNGDAPARQQTQG